MRNYNCSILSMLNFLHLFATEIEDSNFHLTSQPQLPFHNPKTPWQSGIFLESWLFYQIAVIPSNGKVLFWDLDKYSKLPVWCLKTFQSGLFLLLQKLMWKIFFHLNILWQCMFLSFFLNLRNEHCQRVSKLQTLFKSI